MDISQLIAFTRAAHVRNFSRAARELDISQATMSERIQALEAELGGPLFERQGRGVVLTEAGRAFLPLAERALELIDEGREAVRALHTGRAGRVTIAATVTIATYLLAPALRRFHDLQPGIDAQVRSAHSQEVLALVLDGVAQLGLLSGPVVHGGVEVLGQRTEALALVAAPDHPFVHRPAVTLADLSHERLFIAPWGPAYETFLGRLAHLDPAARARWNALSPPELVKAMVAAGFGLSLLPHLAAARELAAGSLVEVHLSDANLPNWEIALIRRRRGEEVLPRPPAVMVLANLLADWLRGVAAIG